MSYLINWDGVGERIYETGTKHGVLYLKDSSQNPEQGIAFTNGVAWNGLTGVTESPSGADNNDIYADDIKYLSIRGAEDFGGTITCYTYPDEWMDCDGSRQPEAGVVVGQQTRLPFGLSYISTKGNDDKYNDYGFKIHLIYNATASPSERAYATINDSPEAIEFSYEFTTTPMEITGQTELKPVSAITIDSTKADAEKLASFMQILYGTPASGATPAVPAKLPTPAQVIAHFSSGN